MGLFIDSSDCVAIGHFEDGEVFDLGVEAVFKLVDGLFEVLVFEQEVVLDVELVFDPQLCLDDLSEELRIAVFVDFIASDGLAAEEVQQHFVDVELEGSSKVKAQEVIRADCLYYPLYEVNPRKLPFNGLIVSLIICFSGCQFIHHLSILPEHLIIAQLSYADPLRWIHLEQPFKKFAQQLLLLFSLEVGLILEAFCQFKPIFASIFDLIKYINALERKIAKEKIVKQNPQRPDIRLFAITLPRKYLRSHINLSPTVSNGRFFIINRPGQPKISNFAEIIIILGVLLDEDILQFDITMDDIILMDVLESVQDLQVDVDGLLEGKHLVWLLVLEVVKIAHVAVLHNQEVPLSLYVIARRTLKSFEEFDDAGVIKHGHSVDFLEQKPFQLRIFDHLFLGDTLDSVVGRGRGSFGCEKDMSESSFSESPYGVELVIIEDVLGLCLQITLQHGLDFYYNKNISGGSFAQHQGQAAWR